MSIFVLGVDLGKTFCSLVGLDEEGAVMLRRTIRRSGLMKTVDKLAPKVIAMEACCGAHFVGRQCQALGIEVRLMPSVYVKPYVKSNKSDDRDAEAIAEAATRPTMRFVPVKSQEQLDLQSVHRLRDRLVGERTGLINQLRAFLFERGISGIEGRPWPRKLCGSRRANLHRGQRASPYAKTGYIDADCNSHSTFILQTEGGPYMISHARCGGANFACEAVVPEAGQGCGWRLWQGPRRRACRSVRAIGSR
jgi:hypothetical protein